MKRVIVIGVVFTAVLVASCKKNNTQPFQSYLKFKLDNVQTECNSHISATYLPPTVGADNIISISGNWVGGAVALKLNEGQVLTPGTYIFQTGTWRSGEIWTDGPASRYYGAGGGGDFNSLVYGSGHIIITAISAEYVKGNFNFVTYIDGATNSFKTVTNGEFYIKRG
jgi:Family of unknown function (DUF6252)